MDFKVMKCPVCGAPLDAGSDERYIICRACDTPLRLNEDATSFLRDPEAFGYGFEKGRQRAQAEEEKRRSGERGSYYAGEPSYRQVPPRTRYQEQRYYNQPASNQPYSGHVNYNYYGGVDPYVSDKDRWTALVICFFLGIFGGHQFYVGNIGKGLLYVFTGGLFGIGWLIDIICLLMGTFKDSNGRVLVSESERRNRQYGNPFGGMPHRNNGGAPYRNYGGAPQQAYRSQPGYSQPNNSQGDYSQSGYGQGNYSQPGYSGQNYSQSGHNDYAEWERKVRRRRRIFLALTILFGISMLGNLFDGEFSNFVIMAILTGVFGYFYYNTPKT